VEGGINSFRFHGKGLFTIYLQHYNGMMEYLEYGCTIFHYSVILSLKHLEFAYYIYTPMKLDILAFASHPDDAELSCGGTLLLYQSRGKKTGVVDFTRGEMGTRGTPETRMQEAEAASKVLKLDVRENLGFADCFFRNDMEHREKVISVIRKYQPEIVLANAVKDRHPDHGRAAQLVAESCFHAGLVKVQTSDGGRPQNAWRIKALYHYIQDRNLNPDFVVDITDWMQKKMEAIYCFKSQFYNPASKEPETPLTGKHFLEMAVENRNAELGRGIGVAFAEGFTLSRIPGVKDLFSLI
jgi:bacillithiol biosynthesis deacetylase BshB1